MSKLSLKFIPWLGLLILLFLIPRFGILYTNIFISFAIVAMFAVSINLLLGFTGLLSFGHAMYFGAGAYATALGLTHIPGLSLPAVILLGGAAAVLLSLVTIPLLVRVSGTAFSMLTLAFGQLMYIICLKFREITGGEDGLGGFPIPPLNLPMMGSIDMTDPVNFYYFAITILGVSIWLMWFFIQTPLGSVMIGIRDNADRVAYLGYQVPQTKAVVFIISGGFAGIAGAVYALFENMVSTDGLLGIYASFNPIIMTVIGGLSSFAGPIVGAGILAILDELLARFTDRIDLVKGLVLILVIMFAPSGFTGLWEKAREKWFKRETGK